MVCKRGHFNSHFRERFFVLKEGVVHYYKLEDMVVDHDNMYCTESSHVRGSISCKGLKVESLDAARHRFGDMLSCCRFLPASVLFSVSRARLNMTA